MRVLGEFGMLSTTKRWAREAEELNVWRGREVKERVAFALRRVFG